MWHKNEPQTEFTMEVGRCDITEVEFGGVEGE